MDIPKNFKDISAFFQSKASIAETTEQKRILRAKRTLRRLRSTCVREHARPLFDRLASSQRIKQVKNNHPTDTSDQKRMFLTRLVSLVTMCVLILWGYSYVLRVTPHSNDSSLPSRPTKTHLIGRNRFFALLTFSIERFIQIFFRIDKLQSQHSIAYVVTSTYEQLSEWFSHFLR